VQETITWADHLPIVYPLRLARMPAAQRTKLAFRGIGPVRTTLFGLVDASNDVRRAK
jgi:hypothetical protein